MAIPNNKKLETICLGFALSSAHKNIQFRVMTYHSSGIQLFQIDPEGFLLFSFGIKVIRM
jgi:hypothetical protein